MTPRSPVSRSDGSALPLAQPVDRLASPPTREQHAIRIVEDDDGLTALLDECPPSDRVGVGHVTRF